MKKAIMVAGLATLLAAFPVMAQQGKGDGGQQQQAPLQQQYKPCPMNPGMMGGYGGYGSGMGPGMMGGYGYGMGPGMMGGYGYGMGPGMMGNYGYGMGPGMMGNYGYGLCPQCGGMQGPRFRSNQEYSDFLDQTKEKRQKLHNLMFEYNEIMRSPDPDREELTRMEKEMDELRNEIFNYKVK